MPAQPNLINATIGRIVHVRHTSEGFYYPNGSKFVAAIVTAAWTPGDMINCRTIVDGPAARDEWLTSIHHEGAIPEGYHGHVWCWPARV